MPLKQYRGPANAFITADVESLGRGGSWKVYPNEQGVEGSGQGSGYTTREMSSELAAPALTPDGIQIRTKTDMNGKRALSIFNPIPPTLKPPVACRRLTRAISPCTLSPSGPAPRRQRPLPAPCRPTRAPFRRFSMGMDALLCRGLSNLCTIACVSSLAGACSVVTVLPPPAHASASEMRCSSAEHLRLLLHRHCVLQSKL